MIKQRWYARSVPAAWSFLGEDSQGLTEKESEREKGRERERERGRERERARKKERDHAGG